MAEIQRKLASIRRIKALVEIPGAERIELAMVDGWQVVVVKGEFKEGDLAVYFEIDSFIPTTIAPFLTKEGYSPSEFNGVKGERLKTTKRMKQLSQGLLLPIKDLPTIGSAGGADQERAQNYGHMIAQNLDTEFEVTVKKDGSSMPVFVVQPTSEFYVDAKKIVEGKKSLWQRIKAFVLRRKDEPVFGICSRNVLLPLDGNSNFHKAAHDVLLALLDEKDSFAIQGEVVAPDIQSNYEKVKEVEFHLFDIFNIDAQQYTYPLFRRQWAEKNGVRHVKVVDKGTLRSILNLQDGEDPVQKLLPYASGEGDNPGVKREGVVFKADTKDFSFKVVSNEYLLAKDKKG